MRRAAAARGSGGRGAGGGGGGGGEGEGGGGWAAERRRARPGGPVRAVRAAGGRQVHPGPRPAPPPAAAAGLGLRSPRLRRAHPAGGLRPARAGGGTGGAVPIGQWRFSSFPLSALIGQPRRLAAAVARQRRPALTPGLPARLPLPLPPRRGLGRAVGAGGLHPSAAFLRSCPAGSGAGGSCCSAWSGSCGRWWPGTRSLPRPPPPSRPGSASWPAATGRGCSPQRKATPELAVPGHSQPRLGRSTWSWMTIFIIRAWDTRCTSWLANVIPLPCYA